MVYLQQLSAEYVLNPLEIKEMQVKQQQRLSESGQKPKKEGPMKKVSGLQKIGVVLVSLAGIVSQSALADTVSQERFSTLLRQNIAVLQSVVKKNPDLFDKSPEKIGEIAVKSSIRGTAFGLQGLARVYAGYPKKEANELFEDIDKSAKQIEDLIGTFEKYASAKKKDDMEKAAKSLAAGIFGVGSKEDGFIDKNGDTSVFDKYLRELEKVELLSASKDREFALKALAKILQDVKDKDYHEMSRLERDLHEFRRNVRWFPIGASALGGVLETSDIGKFQCDLKKQNFAKEAEAGLAKFRLDNFNNKVDDLDQDPADEPKACFVSECSYAELVGVVQAFGDIKDGIENKVINAGGDDTPKKAQVKANKVYESFMKSGALDGLIKQIEKCY